MHVFFVIPHCVDSMCVCVQLDVKSHQTQMQGRSDHSESSGESYNTVRQRKVCLGLTFLKSLYRWLGLLELFCIRTLQPHQPFPKLFSVTLLLMSLFLSLNLVHVLLTAHLQ